MIDMIICLCLKNSKMDFMLFCLYKSSQMTRNVNSEFILKFKVTVYVTTTTCTSVRSIQITIITEEIVPKYTDPDGGTTAAYILIWMVNTERTLRRTARNYHGTTGEILMPLLSQQSWWFDQFKMYETLK